MEAGMRLSWAGAAALLFVCGIAQADGANIPGLPDSDGKIGVGVGVICNTVDQAEAYIRQRRKGDGISLAVSAVNQTAGDPQACGLAAIAFERDKTMDAKTVNGTLVSIVRINVLAGFNGRQWARVPATIQYAIIEAKGIEI
jgi:hypothetical protein